LLEAYANFTTEVFTSMAIVQIGTHRHTHCTDCSTWTTNVVSIYYTQYQLDKKTNSYGMMCHVRSGKNMH